MNYCDKVKDLESRIKVLEDKVFKMNLNQKKDECTIQTNKEPEETKALHEVAKMFKCGWVCQDERCVMWVPHYPKGFPLWNKQKDGVELNVKVKPSFIFEGHPCHINCKTGIKFYKIYWKDVEFEFCDGCCAGIGTIKDLDDPEGIFLNKRSGFEFKVTVRIKDDNTLLDNEILRDLAYELNVTNKNWSAKVGNNLGMLILTKK